ncbi:MAG: hypothetical protein ABH878_01480 [bacterium]
MQICLNNQIKEFPTRGLKSFGDLIDKLADEAKEEGGVILAVKLNGEDYTGKDRSHLQNIPLGEIEEVEIQMGDPKHLVRSTLYSVAEFLEQLLREIQTTAELFRLGNGERANQSLLRCIDGLQVFMHSVESCRRLSGLSFELLFAPCSEPNEQQTVAENRRKIFTLLDDLIEAQSNQDWVLQADMLEYELVPILEDWRHIIPMILDELRKDIPEFSPITLPDREEELCEELT